MRIGIVNDMPLAVEAIRRALALEPAHRIAWVAGNGAEAVQHCAQDLPDLLLMDLLMPVMDGVEATRCIMAQSPCAILIATADVEQHVNRVFAAMGHGALDAVNTPSLACGKEADAAVFLRKIQNIGWLIGQNSTRKRGAPLSVPSASVARRMVAIGSSAGGPAALATLLKQLPSDFNAAVMLVQHVDEVFAAGMADWLSGESALPVRLACEGEQPRAGTVLLAGTNNHMRLQRNGELAYTEEPRSHVYRPSIDVFFDSVVEHWTGEAIGVLLTGMGRDGALGLKNMRTRGFATIAQNQASCAVYGMPKAAAELDAAKEILALERIAPRLVELFR